MSEFAGDDFEFAVGSIKGMRSWAIDDQGRLTGVSHRAIWKPGENLSRCRSSRTQQAAFDKTVQVHHFHADCKCGFWAYDEHSFKSMGDITGVIDGYGKTTIGTKGFRCEKARVVALCRDGVSLSAWLRLQALYPDVKFYNELDDMVVAHGAVMKTWDEVGPDFWDASMARMRALTMSPPSFAPGGVIQP